MHYLRDGLAELGFARVGGVLALVFSVMCIGGSFGGGNMYQSNQAFAQVASVVPALDGQMGSIVFGLALAILVGVVIIGGIKRIGEVAAFLVPIMCVVYVGSGLTIVALHAAGAVSA